MYSGTPTKIHCPKKNLNLCSRAEPLTVGVVCIYTYKLCLALKTYCTYCTYCTMYTTAFALTTTFCRDSDYFWDVASSLFCKVLDYCWDIASSLYM